MTETAEFVFRLDEEGRFPETGLWEVLLTLPILNSASVLNSGQGEGQFMLNGQEWGFYYNSRGPELIAHEPTISLRTAEAIAESVRNELEARLLKT
ncbi:MAG: hypothetical protein AAFP04_10175 [Myxococcota bacterium]